MEISAPQCGTDGAAALASRETPGARAADRDAPRADFRVVYINMDSDLDRRAHIESALRRLDVRFRRFAGLTPSAAPVEIVARFAAGAGLTEGEIGCGASHLAIAAKAAAGAWTAPLLVLEDDVIVPEGLRDVVEETLRAAPVDWDVIKLDAVQKSPALRVARLAGASRDVVAYLRAPMRTAAYLLSASGARKIAALEQIDAPIDVTIAQAWRNGLNIYGVAPAPARLAAFESSIDHIDGGRAKRRRRRRFERATTVSLRRAAYQARRFGLSGWARLLVVSFVNSALRKFGRAELQRLVLDGRVRGAGRAREATPPSSDNPSHPQK